MKPAAPPITPRGTEEGEIDRITMVITKRDSNGADGASPKHGALEFCEYGLLTLEGPAGDSASVGPKGNGDDPEDTTGIGGTNRTNTGTVERDK